MTSNECDTKGLKTLSKKERLLKWQNFDAQPRAIKEWLHNFPLHVWPNSAKPVSDWSIRETEKIYLADLESVWGPDHPAVQDAKRRVVKTRKGLQEVLDLNDLDSLF